MISESLRGADGLDDLMIVAQARCVPIFDVARPDTTRYLPTFKEISAIGIFDLIENEEEIPFSNFGGVLRFRGVFLTFLVVIGMVCQMVGLEAGKIPPLIKGGYGQLVTHVRCRKSHRCSNIVISLFLCC